MEKIGFSTVITPAILPRFESTPNCTVTKCAAFYLACATK